MTDLLIEPFRALYLQRALIEVLLLGVLAGVVGVHVVLRRLAFVADTYTHTVFPGMAVAFALGGSVFIGALAAGLLSAVLFTVLDRSRRVTSDAALAVLLTSFFAVGVIVISRTDRYTADLTALLFGRILLVDNTQIAATAVLTVLVVGVVLALHKELVLRAFDPAGAEALGLPGHGLDLLVNLAVVVVVVAAAQAVGTLLTVALLITPAATARLVARSVPQMYVISVAVGLVAGWLGLVASYEAGVHHGLRLASGATVVLAMTLLFALVFAGRSVGRAAVVANSRRVAEAGT